MKKKSVFAIALALVMSLTCLTGCGSQVSANIPAGTELSSGGVLVLSVNPEIAVEYDNTGIVTGITARNDDALAIINACTGLIGRQTRDAVSILVTAIGDAGYFVEEIDGERRQITIEIESGSSLPGDNFLDDVIAYVKAAVDSHNWQTPLNIEADTDYGPNNDGVTDYDDTGYGPNNDGVTDYDDTDYGPDNDGITDYDDSNYGATDYDDTDYDDTDYDDSDYDDSDYDDSSDYGSSDYRA